MKHSQTKKQTLKKALALLLIAVTALFALAGCSKKKTSATLTIATSPDYPPFESLDASGKVVGIEIDVMNLIAQDLGMTLKIEQVQFDSVLPGIQAGKYDVGVSGITVTEQRKKNVLFTDPYCLAAQAIVVPSGSAIKGKADLAGKTVSVQSGTTAESFCMEQGYKVNSYDTNSDAETALTTGKVDAWVIDDLTAKEMTDAYNAAHPGALVMLDEAMTTEPYAFALKLDNADLCTKINASLQKLVKNGTVKGIFEKYGAPYTEPAI